MLAAASSAAPFSAAAPSPLSHSAHSPACARCRCSLFPLCAGHVATLHNTGSLRSPRCTPLVCITTIRPREGESRKRNRSQLGVWASQRYDRECALVVSPEHPHYRGDVTPGVLRRRAGPSGGLPPPGAAPLMWDLSRIHHRCYDQAYSAGDVPMTHERPRGALTRHTRCTGVTT